MNFKKILFLVLALLLPIAVFLFLKSFGKNEFAVEPLFQKEVLKPTNCSFTYQVPYVINDSILTQLNWSEDDSLTVLIFDQSANKKNLAQETRLKTELPGNVSFIANIAGTTEMSCAFLLKANDNAVLIDSKKRIMGQYDLTDLDEADRLIMEANIILKKY
jgi:hypothetical protein